MGGIATESTYTCAYLHRAQTNCAREALTNQKKLASRFFRDLFETFAIFGEEKRTIRLKELRRQASEPNETPGRYRGPETRRMAYLAQYSFVREPQFLAVARPNALGFTKSTHQICILRAHRNIGRPIGCYTYVLSGYFS